MFAIFNISKALLPSLRQDPHFLWLYIVWSVRIARLRWAGHVRRMDEEALPRRIMHVTPIGQREAGRARASWREEAGKDARMLGIRS
jgi:hypothetical protein